MKKGNSRRRLVVLSAGLDEVGMGALAGPITIAVLAFKQGCKPIEGVRDSKKLSRKRREELAPKIVQKASFIGIGWAGPDFIDDNGIAAAWHYSVQQALKNAPMERMNLIIDGTRKVTGVFAGMVSMPKADDMFWQVGAASILAKVLRDNHMKAMAEHYVGFGWETNAGYGSKKHRDHILKVGPTPYHRITFLKKLRKQAQR